VTPHTRFWFWVLTVLGAACLVGTSAWALWSDNPAWMLLFSMLAALFLLAAVLLPVAAHMRSMFTGNESKSGSSRSRRR
jgi:hypothetical protein